ncbi:unknown [Firmicutes bacterium CAG:170]|nr:unknown [Firmicutes bacterium CAG:170]
MKDLDAAFLQHPGGLRQAVRCGAVFFDAHHGQPAPSGDPDRAGVLCVRRLTAADACSGQLRAERAADLKRDASLTQRRDRRFVQHLHPDGGERLKLIVAQRRDGLRLRHDARVGGQHARHIRPVFAEIRVERRRGQTSGHIGAAPGKRMERTAREPPVKAGRYDFPAVREGLERCVGFLPQDIPCAVEVQPVGGVHERKAQQLRHQPCGQIFPARGQRVALGLRRERGVDRVQLLFDRDLQAAAVPNFDIALRDPAPQLPARDVILQIGMAKI